MQSYECFIASYLGVFISVNNYENIFCSIALKALYISYVITGIQVTGQFTFLEVLFIWSANLYFYSPSRYITK